MVLLLLGSILSTVFALHTVGRADQAIVLWPVGGLVIALCLPVWQSGWRNRIVLMLITAVGAAIGGSAAGQPLSLAAIVGALTAIDLLIAAAILSPAIRVFDDLKRRANILRFVVAAIVAPMVTGALGAYPVSAFIHVPVLRTAISSMFADSLGIAMVLPALLFLVGGEYRSISRLLPHFKRTAPWVFLFVAVSFAVFWQNTGPFLFVIFPPMIVLLLVLGLEGAVFASILLSVFGWFATTHGHGPIMLMHGASPETRLLILQVFVWVCIATSMPVGALLDERKRAEHLAREAQSIYQLLLRNAKDTIVLSAMDGSRRYASPAITDLTGWTPEEYMALHRDMTYHSDDRGVVHAVYDGLANGRREQAVRYRLAQKDGGFKWVEATVRAYGDNEIAGYVSTIRDISALRQAEQKWLRERHELTQEKKLMASLAETDPLTRLLNRRGLDEQLRKRSISGGQFAVIMVDVDYFKLYNDTYGHQAGDQCLIQVAEILRAHAGRRGDLAARYGGEEFVLVLSGTDESGALSVARDIRKDFHTFSFPHERSPLRILTVSIGVASNLAPPGFDMTVLLTQADRALYESKHSGRDRVSAFDPVMEPLVA